MKYTEEEKKVIEEYEVSIKCIKITLHNLKMELKEFKENI